MPLELAEASARRQASVQTSDIDDGLMTLLAHYQAVTADPKKMGYLRFLVAHYAKDPHPWAACFTADTPVDCPRDHERFPNGVPISDLVEGDLVWSFNTEQYVFELKPVKWSSMTRRGAQLVMVTLDDGSQIKCTPDHRFMRRDTTYVEAQDIVSGDSLMPLYRDYIPMVRRKPESLSWAPEHRPRTPTKEPMDQARLCANCGTEFDPRSGRQRHCSATCRKSYSQKAWAAKPEAATNFNHKVVSVVLLDERQDVWDIEVVDNHNFVVSGVVVHNCFHDNLKRFGAKTPALCGVLKDVIRQRTDWRGKSDPNHTDHGAPGVAIANSDKGAANPPWGPWMHSKLSDNVGGTDMKLSDIPEDVWAMLADVVDQCDPCKVLLGVEDAPFPSSTFLEESSR